MTIRNANEFREATEEELKLKDGEVWAVEDINGNITILERDFITKVVDIDSKLIQIENKIKEE
jgi:hypothetical protein